jgi:hypothetical protein
VFHVDTQIGCCCGDEADFALQTRVEARAVEAELVLAGQGWREGGREGGREGREGGKEGVLQMLFRCLDKEMPSKNVHSILTVSSSVTQKP